MAYQLIKRVLIILLLISPHTLWAANSFESNIKSLRQKAMGGVSVTTSQDDFALHQNPASLASLEGFRMKLLYANIGINDNFHSILNKVTQNKGLDSSDMIALVEDFIPSDLDMNFGFAPLLSAQWRGGAVGVYQMAEFHGGIADKTAPLINLSGYNDAMGALGLAKNFSLWGYSFDAGFTAKVLARSIVYDPDTGKDEFRKSMVEIVNESKTDNPDYGLDVYTLVGGGLDLGLRKNFENELFQGSFGFSFKNVFSNLSGTKEVNVVLTEDEQDDVVTLPRSATFGFSITEHFVLLGDIMFSADYRFYSPEPNIRKNIFMGAEKTLFNGILALRGGIHHGYIVGGFGIDLVHFHLDYAVFHQELGEKIGHNPRASQQLQVAFFY